MDIMTEPWIPGSVDTDMYHCGIAFKRDRKDLYKAFGTRTTKDLLRIEIVYELISVKCNPDFDW